MLKQNGLVTVQEAAEYLKVHENTILRWIQDKTLPAYKVGKLWRIKETDLTKFTEPKGGDGKQLA